MSNYPVYISRSPGLRFDKEIYRIIDDMNSPEELINDNTKIVSLNFFQSQVASIKETVSDTNIINKLVAIEEMLSDAYNLSMYQFQFKLFTEILSKEIQNIQEEISFG